MLKRQIDEDALHGGQDFVEAHPDSKPSHGTRLGIVGIRARLAANKSGVGVIDVYLLGFRDDWELDHTIVVADEQPTTERQRLLRRTE